MARDMGDVGVLEAAQHMGDGIDLADVGEELVAQAFAVGSTLHQARDVDELELGVDDLGRAGDGRELVQPRIGHGDAADIGLDGAEWIVGRLRRLGGGERIEQGRLADIGQADDPTVETHFLTLSTRQTLRGVAWAAAPSVPRDSYSAHRPWPYPLP